VQQGNFIHGFLARQVSGYTRPSSGALDIELQHMVFCTKFLDGWWSWEPLRRSFVRCGWCRTAPSAPETCRAKNTLIKLTCYIKLAFQI